MYLSCNQCGFNVLKSDSSCPNCGNVISFTPLVVAEKLIKPLKETDFQLKKSAFVEKNRLISWGKSSLLGAAISLIFTLPVAVFIADPIRVFIFFVVGTIFLSVAVGEYKRSEREKVLSGSGLKSLPASFTRKIDSGDSVRGLPGRSKKPKRREIPIWSLMGKNETALTRLRELGERKDRINYVSKKIRSANNKNLKPVIETLAEAKELIDVHIGRYKLQRQKVLLVLAQNSLAPYLENVAHLNEQEAKKGLKICFDARQKLRAIEKKNRPVQRYLSAENKELRAFEAQIRETHITIQKLEEAILRRKAMLAIEGIKSIEDTFDSSDFGDLAHRLETFGARSALVDFSESFEELETEYKRLRAENEASQKLLEE